ncbi:MAG: glycosyltransferase, partial [Chloroflexi bacterium]|nr:glycosyltransferase [Chloroflexota bacterium]
MPRLLLITHRPPSQAGGPAARWRSLLRDLQRAGWEVEVLCGRSHTTSSEFVTAAAQRSAVARRAQVMSVLRRATTPLFRVLGIRPPPLSTVWVLPGVRSARNRLRRRQFDLVLGTGPPMVALVVARLAVTSSDIPLVIELRDLWAGNPAYDAGGRSLQRLEAWVLGRAQAVVVCTPEAATDLRRRHPESADRVHMIPNGFEPELLAARRAPAPREGTLEILHSGTLTTHRPLTPLLEILRQEPYRSRI